MTNGRLNHMNGRVTSLFLTRENDQNIELRWQKEKRKYKYNHDVLFPSFSFISPVPLLLSGAFAHRGEIQLSPLYRSSTDASALRSLNASHRMIRGITRRRIMRFIILMRQPAKQDLYDDGESTQGQRAPG